MPWLLRLMVYWARCRGVRRGSLTVLRMRGPRGLEMCRCGLGGSKILQKMRCKKTSHSEADSPGKGGTRLDAGDFLENIIEGHCTFPALLRVRNSRAHMTLDYAPTMVGMGSEVAQAPPILLPHGARPRCDLTTSHELVLRARQASCAVSPPLT